MPLPLVPIIMGGLSVYAAKKAVDARKNFTEASQLNTEAKEILAKAEAQLQQAGLEAGAEMEALQILKKEIYENCIMSFIKTSGSLKNSSVQINLPEEQINEALYKPIFEADDSDSDLDRLSAWLSDDTVSVIRTVLLGRFVPVTDLFLAAKAKDKLRKTYKNMITVDIAAENMRSAAKLCGDISERCRTVSAVLRDIRDLIAADQKEFGETVNKNNDFSTYSEKEVNLTARLQLATEVLLEILQIKITEEDGSLSKESSPDNLNRIAGVLGISAK